jgi:hypothetical protein
VGEQDLQMKKLGEVGSNLSFAIQFNTTRAIVLMVLIYCFEVLTSEEVTALAAQLSKIWAEGRVEVF